MKRNWLLLLLLLCFEERLIAQDPYLQALGNSHFDFLFDDDKWQIEDTTGVDGKSCISNLPMNDEDISAFTAIIHGPVILSFWWKSSTEKYFDEFYVLLDEKVVETINGESGWQRSSIKVPEGEHLISWVYAKDESLSEGMDSVWLDNIEIYSETHARLGLINHDLIISDYADLTFDNNIAVVRKKNEGVTNDCFIIINRNGSGRCSLEIASLDGSTRAHFTLKVNGFVVDKYSVSQDKQLISFDLTADFNKVELLFDISDNETALKIYSIRFNETPHEFAFMDSPKNLYKVGDSIIFNLQTNFDDFDFIELIKDNTVIGVFKKGLTYNKVFADKSDTGSYYCKVKADGRTIYSNTQKILVEDPLVDQREWTIFVYGSADNNLGKQLLADLIEMQNATLGTNVKVLVQTDFDSSDRFLKLFSKKKGFSPLVIEQVSRFILPNYQDNSSIKENSGPAMFLDETNDMDDSTTLEEFLEWGTSNFTAKRYGIIFWNHGYQWRGYGGDSQNGTKKTKQFLQMDEIATTINNIEWSNESGIPDFCIFDACLMGGFEVLDKLHKSFKYIVGNPGLEFGRGLDYTQFFSYLNEHYYENTIELLTVEQDIWKEHHTTKVDLALMSHSLYDTQYFQECKEATGQLFDAITRSDNKEDINKAVTRSQVYGLKSVTEIKKAPEFRDFPNFVSNINQNSNKSIHLENAALRLEEILDKLIVKKVLGDNLNKESGGLSMSFSLNDNGVKQNYLSQLESFSPPYTFLQFLETQDIDDLNVNVEVSYVIDDAYRWTNFVGGDSTYVYNYGEQASPNILLSNSLGLKDFTVDLTWDLGDGIILSLGSIDKINMRGDGQYEIKWNGSASILANIEFDHYALFPLWKIDEELGFGFAQILHTNDPNPKNVLIYFDTSVSPGNIVGIYSDDEIGLSFAGEITLNPGDKIFPKFLVEDRNGDFNDWTFDEMVINDIYVEVGGIGVDSIQIDTVPLNEFEDGSETFNLETSFYDWRDMFVLMHEINIKYFPDISIFPHIPDLHIDFLTEPFLPFLWWEFNSDKGFKLQGKNSTFSNWISLHEENQVLDEELDVIFHFDADDTNLKFYRLHR
jgi:hypothetical protein